MHNLALALTPSYTLAQARAAYAAVIASYPLSTWADNAQYQIGKTYYDELNYVAAIPEFSTVLTSYVLPTYADSAQYYLARSIHTLALVPAPAPAPVYTLANARAEYAKLLASSPTSYLADNAQFQIGKTWYDELNYMQAIFEFSKGLANYPVATAVDETYYYRARSYEKLAAPDYLGARADYSAIVNGYQTSIYMDNAVYHVALTYHGTMQCATELLGMQAFVAAYPLSPFVASANSHITDLLAVPSLHHTICQP